MAFGDIYGYVTNSNVIPAVALRDEDDEEDTVDLLLLGVDQGKRYGVPVAADEESAETNEAFAAAGEL